MGRATRKIKKHPLDKNYFLVDTCFLANKYIPINTVKNLEEKDRIRKCREWWVEIDAQIDKGRGIVYVPEICIAETYKVFAKKYYKDKDFSSQQFKSVRDRFTRDTHIDPKDLLKHSRHVRYHDIVINRDIVIGVKRFYEGFYKKNLNVSIVDLCLLAIGKYLMDFYGFTRRDLFIVTQDRPLARGARQFSDIPFVFCPFGDSDLASKVFI